MQGPPAPPQKLNVQLEGLGAYQEGAAALQAGTPLAVREEGARLVCVTQSGAPVGLIPADKRGVLSRGPWSGTVRSVKRQAAPPPAAGQQPQPQPAEPRQPQQEGQQEGQPAAEPAQGAAEPAPAEAQQQEQQQRAAAVVQVLVRFTPEEQRWQARQPEGGGGPQGEELDTALLSTEQYEALAASEELRWMLRDERLQRVVAEVDAAPNREQALLRALQAPNFKEFADKVLGVVAPDAA